jgi:hypothetical protein
MKYVVPMQRLTLADAAKLFLKRYLQDRCTLDVDRYDTALSTEHTTTSSTGGVQSTGSTWYIAFAVLQHAKRFQASYARAPEQYSLFGCHQSSDVLRVLGRRLP